MSDALIRKCTEADLEILRSIGIETFTDTFAPQNTPENMAAYLAVAYAPQKLQTELTTPGVTFYLLLTEAGTPAGYLKLNAGNAQTEVLADDTLEVERIYIRQGFQKQGLGRYLLEFALDTARQSGKKHLWLGVWEHNQNARAFYRKLGFRQVGSHTFQLGADLQTDLLLIKNL